MGFLAGKRALIVGLATERSIAYGIAAAMHREGAELAFTYQNDRLKDRVAAMANEFGASLVLPMDVASDAEIDAAFTALREDGHAMQRYLPLFQQELLQVLPADIHGRRDDPAVPLERAFAMLAEVGTGADNQWRIVYDLRAKAIHFTVRGKSERVSLGLTALDFQCSEAAVKTLDLAGPIPAQAAVALKPYRPEDNLELVRSSIARTEFLQPFPEERLLGIAGGAREAGEHPSGQGQCRLKFGPIRVQARQPEANARRHDAVTGFLVQPQRGIEAVDCLDRLAFGCKGHSTDQQRQRAFPPVWFPEKRFPFF